MMETRDLIIMVAVVAYAGIRLYMRYGKKNTETKSKSKSRETMGNTNTDYEPYS